MYVYIIGELYDGSPIKVQESMVLVLTYAVRHKLSYEAITDLLSLLNLHCPQPNYISKSFWLFQKFFKNVSAPIERHYYCPLCKDIVPGFEVMECETCSANLQGREKGYFITLALDLQIQDIFKSK